MSYYIIKEHWQMGGDTEFYQSITDSFEQVQKTMQEWIESWKENSDENEYKWKGSKIINDKHGNPRAYCYIERDESGIDSFKMIVIKKEGEMPKERVWANSISRAEFENLK